MKSNGSTSIQLPQTGNEISLWRAQSPAWCIYNMQVIQAISGSIFLEPNIQMQYGILNCQLMYWAEIISILSILWVVSSRVFSSAIISSKLLSLENKQSGQCMVHLEYWENKQPRICFLLVYVALFGMCAPDTLLFFFEAEVLFKIKLLIWYSWAILFWRTTAMSGFGALLRRNQFILLVLFLLQIQSLGLDMDSRPTTEVCATHTIAPGPKGEERNKMFINDKWTLFSPPSTLL